MLPPSQSHPQSQPSTQSSTQSQSTVPVEIPPRLHGIADDNYFRTLHPVGRRAYRHGLQEVVRGLSLEQSTLSDELSPWSFPASRLCIQTIIVIIRVKEMDPPRIHEFGSIDVLPLSLEKDFGMTENESKNSWVALKVVVRNPDGTKIHIASVAEEDLQMMRTFPDNSLEQVQLKYLRVQNYLGVLFPIPEYTIRSHPQSKPQSQSLSQSQLSEPLAAPSFCPFYNANYIRTLHPIGQQPYLRGIADAMASLYRHEPSPWALPASCLPTATLFVHVRVRGMYDYGYYQFSSTDELVIKKEYGYTPRSPRPKWPALRVYVKRLDGSKFRVGSVAKEDNYMVKEFPDLEREGRLMFLHAQDEWNAHFILFYPTSEYDLGARIPKSIEVDFSCSQIAS